MSLDIKSYCNLIATADEAALRDTDVPWPKTEDELQAILKALKDRQHDYGTCVYAMSIAALAAFYLVSHWLGVTGFQASCADMDFIRRTRSLKYGFRITDYGNLLYPQYCDDEKIPGWETLMKEEGVRARLGEAARELLAKNEMAHPNVVAHWQLLAGSPPAHNEEQQ